MSANEPLALKSARLKAFSLKNYRNSPQHFHSQSKRQSFKFQLVATREIFGCTNEISRYNLIACSSVFRAYLWQLCPVLSSRTLLCAKDNFNYPVRYYRDSIARKDRQNGITLAKRSDLLANDYSRLQSLRFDSTVSCLAFDIATFIISDRLKHVASWPTKSKPSRRMAG